MPGKDKGNGAKARGAHQQLNKEYFLGEPLTTVGEDDRGLVAAVAPSAAFPVRVRRGSCRRAKPTPEAHRHGLQL